MGYMTTAALHGRVPHAKFHAKLFTLTNQLTSQNNFVKKVFTFPIYRWANRGPEMGGHFPNVTQLICACNEIQL